MYKRNTEALSRNHFRRGKAVSIVYSECVSVALVIQDAMCMRRITLSYLTCPDVPYSSTSSHKCHDSRKNVKDHKMCLPYFSEIFLILRRIHRYIIVNVQRYSCKAPAIFSYFNYT